MYIETFRLDTSAVYNYCKSSFPETFLPWITSWLKNHPDWEYWFWTDNETLQLRHTEPGLDQAYRGLKDGSGSNDLTKLVQTMMKMLLYFFS